MLLTTENFDKFVGNIAGTESNVQVQDVVKDYIIRNIEKTIFEKKVAEQKKKMKDEQFSLEEKVNSQKKNFLNSLNI